MGVMLLAWELYFGVVVPLTPGHQWIPLALPVDLKETLPSPLQTRPRRQDRTGPLDGPGRNS